MKNKFKKLEKKGYKIQKMYQDTTVYQTVQLTDLTEDSLRDGKYLIENTEYIVGKQKMILVDNEDNVLAVGLDEILEFVESL